MWKYTLTIILLQMAAASVPCAGEPAQFWISTSGTAPTGPVAMTLQVIENSQHTIHIWGRPAEGKKFKNVSLDLVASQPGVDFVDSGTMVYNVVDASRQRFEYVSDANTLPPLQSSRTMAEVMAGDADSIVGLQGFTITANENVHGIGPTCLATEVGCYLADDGQPAWLIASATFAAVMGGPTTELYLRIGEHALNHETLAPGDYDFNGTVHPADMELWRANYGSSTATWADGDGSGLVDAPDYVLWRDNLGRSGAVEPTALSSVRFGLDTNDGMPEPVYNAATDRQMTLAGDDPDMVITIAPPGSGATVYSTQVPEPPTLAACAVAVLAGFCRRAIWRPMPSSRGTKKQARRPDT